VYSLLDGTEVGSGVGSNFTDNGLTTSERRLSALRLAQRFFET